ncbi:MAG: hypothetical protein IJ161_00575 [Bacteroidales bacterium]|nr:hypothetical protein [Bacteroidales bacterium]
MRDFFLGVGTGHSLMILCFVIGIGLLLGRIRIKGVRTGSIWVLFVGIVSAAFGARTDQLFLHFLKEFGLIVYVFSVGLQVGEGFQFSGRGYRLKSVSIAALQVILLFAGVFLIGALSGEDSASLVGIATGAVNGVPGLGTAQQAWYDAATGTFLSEVENPTASSRIGVAFSLAYPAGVLGLGFVLWLITKLSSGQSVNDSVSAIADDDINTAFMEVTNPAVFGKHLSEVKDKLEGNFVVVNISKGDDILMECDDPVLEKGDRILVESDPDDIKTAAILFGTEISIDESSRAVKASLGAKKNLVVTRSAITGHTVKELGFLRKYGVTLLRVIRGSAQLLPTDSMYLKVGDRITVSGKAEDVSKVASLVGNSNRELDWPYLVPIFLGMAIGVVLGAIPFNLPGMDSPLRLGLSGGVFLIAVLLGKFGPSWRITTYTTPSAILMIRETGLALLLATIGLGCGSSLLPLLSSGGYMWFVYGFILSALPSLIVALVGCHLMHFNPARVMGCIAASSTSPFAINMLRRKYSSQAMDSSYNLAYPVSLFIQIIMVIILVHIAI